MAELFLVARDGVESSSDDGHLEDAAARVDALRTDSSWVVEAPAGSGKTGLLIQRYLKLLATGSVDRPEQVLAITFTEKATAEMRERVLGHLEGAAVGGEAADDFDAATRTLAEAVLEKDRALAWGLLGSPARLNIRTIHSVSAEIARAMPVLSGSGGRLHPVEDASGLYHDAARRTLMQLGGEDGALDMALRLVMLHRDGNLAEVERLVAAMLERREQWGELVSLSRGHLEDGYLDGEVLPRLERALEVAVCGALTRVATAIPSPVLGYLSLLAGELGGAEGYKGGANPIAICRRLREAPGDTLDDLDHWIALAHLLLTKSGEWRKGLRSDWLNVTIDKLQIARLKTVLDELRGNDAALAAIRGIGCLPPAKYPEEQWQVVKALFRILSRALVELQILFAEREQCDFTELELAAKSALRGGAGGHDLAETLGMRIEHLLVDEMQDTSSGQAELIEMLTLGWDGHSQTVFLVGDPKQSIYMFRQARVERFLRTMRTGRFGDLPLGCLRLTANFRSQARLVDGFNDDFARLFPAPERAGMEEVTYTEASATRASAVDEGRAWHAAVLPFESDAGVARQTRQEQRRIDARQIRAIFERWRARPLSHGRVKPWTMAVLVRGREHLKEIVAALRGEAGGSALPYHAVEIEPLKDRQIVLDLVAITRALLHPADRVGWLAVLHAPWCGLGLADLHMLAGADDPQFEECCIEDLIEQRGDLLSEDGIERLKRLWPVLQAAARQRGRLNAAQWVERTWRWLGGDAYATEAELLHARRYLQLLDEIESERGSIAIGVLERRLERLYAEPAISDGAIDLMTIHGAKGLEWDVVIVPALERKARPSRGGLLSWVELDSSEQDAAQVVLAPIEPKGVASRDLRNWIATVHKQREVAERKRLFYVACTRAREALHLFASGETKQNGEVKYATDSLLAAAWPAAEGYFTVAAASSTEAARVVEIREYEEPLALAAAGDGDEALRTRTGKPPKLYRLPLTFDAQARFPAAVSLSSRAEMMSAPGNHFERPEGSYAARVFGNAMHAFLEMLTLRFGESSPEQPFGAEAALQEVAMWVPRIETLLRGDGLPPGMVKRLAVGVQQGLQAMLRDPVGQWILLPREGDATEGAVTTWTERRATVRVDRMFRAGSEPLAAGTECLWIVDYKTGTHGREGLDDFLQSEQQKYRGQTEAYARALAGRSTELRVGLYFPTLAKLVWWRPEAASLGIEAS